MYIIWGINLCQSISVCILSLPVAMSQSLLSQQCTPLAATPPSMWPNNTETFKDLCIFSELMRSHRLWHDIWRRFITNCYMTWCTFVTNVYIQKQSITRNQKGRLSSKSDKKRKQQQPASIWVTVNNKCYMFYSSQNWTHQDAARRQPTSTGTSSPAEKHHPRAIMFFSVVTPSTSPNKQTEGGSSGTFKTPILCQNLCTGEQHHRAWMYLSGVSPGQRGQLLEDVEPLLNIRWCTLCRIYCTLGFLIN